jgi:photosystem II stability/assembly factor-like uncharacterized protein
VGGGRTSQGTWGTILISGDGGASWSSNTSNNWDDLAGIACPTSRVCIAAGGTTILASADGGATWTTRTFSAPSRPDSASGTYLAGIACYNSSACVAVGAGGTIVTSTDGGVGWINPDSGTDNGLQGVTCTTGGTVLATRP